MDRREFLRRALSLAPAATIPARNWHDLKGAR
jgi:hypothetical protein